MMLNNSLLNSDQWTQPASASCFVLKWIGVYLCFVFVCGIVLNIFVLYTIINKKHLQSPISIYIIALSSADLLHALFGIPLPLTSNFACRWLYGKYLCYYEGFLAYFVGMIGLYLLTTLSLTRYWMIVIDDKTKPVSFQTAYKSVFFSILGSLFWAGAPIIGWNHYTLEGVGTSCSILWHDRSISVVSYNVSMFIFAYIIPLFIMIYCNMRIYFKVRELSYRRSVWKHETSILRIYPSQNIDNRIGRTIFFIIVTFTVAWTPYAIVAFISAFISPDLISPLGGTLPAIFAKSSIYFNPLVYLMSNSHIRSQISRLKKPTVKFSDSASTKEKHDRSHSARVELTSL